MNSVLICVYDIESGEIKWHVECPESQVKYQTGSRDDLDHIVVQERVNAGTHYIKDKKVVPRPVLKFNKVVIKANDQDIARLIVGEPFECEIDDATYTVDGVLEITAAMPARYKVRVIHFPFQDLDQEITAK